MVAKIASTEEQRTHFQPMLPPQAEGNAQHYVKGAACPMPPTHGSASIGEFERRQIEGNGQHYKNGAAGPLPATHGGEIIDENEHRHRRHRHHVHHDNGQHRGAYKAAPLSPNDSHAVVDWLKNNAPSWLLSMLGLAPIAAVQAPRLTDQVATIAVNQIAAGASKSADAAEILAGDASLWKHKDSLAADDLNDIIAHPSQHPLTTVAAAQTMLENPAEFGKADGIKTGGVADGQVWKQDLIAYAKSVRAAESRAAASGALPTDEQALARFMQMALNSVMARREQQEAQRAQEAQQEIEPEEESEADKARRTLQDDDKLWKGKSKLSATDLQNILTNPTKHPPETVAASLFMLQHAEAFNGNTGIAPAADSAATSAKSTAAIATGLAAAATTLAASELFAAATATSTDTPALSDADAAMQTLQEDDKLWGDKTVLNATDLQNVITNPKNHPAETVDAARYLLMHADVFDGAKGIESGAGTGARGGFAAGVDTASLMGAPASASAIAAAASAAMSDGVDAGNLEGTDPSGLIQAGIDAADSAALLTAAPADTALDTTGLSDNGPEAVLAMQTLLDDATLWQGKNGITAKDLQNVVDNPAQHGADTVAAATFLLQHPVTFTMADGGASGGAIDGQIWKQDLVAAIDQSKAAAGTSAAEPAADPTAVNANALLTTLMAQLNASAAADALATDPLSADTTTDLSAI